MTITLPFPPSVNHYWRTRVVPARKPFVSTYVSRKGKQYKAQVAAVCHDLPRTESNVCVSITLHPPDRRQRDLDNSLKALLDAIKGDHGLIVDDSQIKHLTVQWGAVVPCGKAIVELEEIAEAQAELFT